MKRRLYGSLLAVGAWGAAAAVSALLCWILAEIFIKGAGEISLEFLTGEPLDAGRAGGITPVIAATLQLVLLCAAVSLPIGFGAAVFLSELSAAGPRLASLVRTSLDILAAVPSIVFGLFGNAVFCHLLGLGYSILSGALTLVCMVLPILIRTSEQALRAVPDDYRHGAAALGLSRLTTLRSILLPAAAPALGAGMVLGIGRALAETAALLYTAGYLARMPGSILDSGRSLSVHIYDLSMNVPGGDSRAYATALVLVAVLLALNSATVLLLRNSSAGGDR